jgi:predicted RNA binding protein YcfA (HicA-like mRNA interferase family)
LVVRAGLLACGRIRVNAAHSLAVIFVGLANNWLEDSARYVYLIHMNAREVLKLLKADGWTEVRSKGSHVQLKHPAKPGLVTLPMHGSKDIKPGTLASIEKQAGLKLRRR